MRKPIKVYVVGYDWCNITSFLLFDFEKVDNIKEADIVMFTGGEDINPALYGDVPHPTTHFTNRDDMEVLAFKDAPKEALLIGGCRGAQLLTALSGGKLFQHVTGHGGGTGGHNITTSDNRTVRITSCHHQMMNPYDLLEEDYELLAWSTVNLSSAYCIGAGPVEVSQNFKEPEIVYYPKTRALCIQGHPEWMPKDQPVIAYINELIEKYL